MRKIYIIEGLDCPNCAKIIENHLNNAPEIKKAIIDFVGKKLFISYQDNQTLSEEQLMVMISTIEDGIKITDSEKKDNHTPHNHTHNHTSTFEITILRLVFSSVLIAFAHFWELADNVKLIVYICSYLLSSYDVLVSCFKNLIKGRVFTEFTLMTIATIGALIIGENLEAVLIMILYQIGELLQDASVEKSRKLIKDTIDLRPTTATLIKEDGTFTIVEPAKLMIDNIIDIKVGEMVPVDAIVIQGDGAINMASLTGESIPVIVSIGEEVLSGTTLISGHLVCKVMKTYKNSTANKILELIETNGEKKSKAEKFVSKFASIYVPIIFALAFIIGAIVPIFVGDFNTWVYKALILLVASCPCSLVISIPLAYFVGMGELASKGIVVKGASYLDSLIKVKTIVTDKTGTLTEGRFDVVRMTIIDMEENQFVEYLVAAESISNHPLAKGIIEYCGIQINQIDITEKEEIPGLGVKVVYKGHKIVVGGFKLVTSAKIDPLDNGSIVYVEVDGIYKGCVVLNDEIKPTSYEFVNFAHQKNLDVVILTGDKKENAIAVAKALKVNGLNYELLPKDKVDALEKILNDQSKRNVIYIGDGINDAPSLIRADIGIAMGGVGSDSALESADIIIMNDKLTSVTTTIEVAKQIRNTSIANIIISLGVKLIVYILALLDVSSMWMALVADVGVTLLLVLNSLRLKSRISKKHYKKQ